MSQLVDFRGNIARMFYGNTEIKTMMLGSFTLWESNFDNVEVYVTPVTSAREESVYSGFTATASGGDTNYTFSLNGTWPPGLSIDSNTGTVSGTTTTPGIYNNLSIGVSDNSGHSANSSLFTITVNNAIELIWSYAQLGNTAINVTNSIGDLIVLFDGSDSQTGSPALPAGFTNIANQATTSSGATSLRASRKIAAADNETIDGAASTVSHRIVHVYRGVNSTTPIAAIANTARNTSETLQVPVLATVNPKGLVVGCIRARGEAPSYSFEVLNNIQSIQNVSPSFFGQLLTGDSTALVSSFAGEDIINTASGKSVGIRFVINKST
jgi:hypothetical protein